MLKFCRKAALSVFYLAVALQALLENSVQWEAALLFCSDCITWQGIKRCALGNKAWHIFSEEAKTPAGQLEGIWGVQTSTTEAMPCRLWNHHLAVELQPTHADTLPLIFVWGSINHFLVCSMVLTTFVCGLCQIIFGFVALSPFL